MNQDKKWMLMTYYCPTHGDAGKVEPIQVTRQEIYSKLYDKNKSLKVDHKKFNELMKKSKELAKKNWKGSTFPTSP